MGIENWNMYEMEERELWTPRFGGNLAEFIRRMVEQEGFTLGNLFPLYEGRHHNIIEGKGIALDDYEEIAYQALNYEHTNLDFEKEGHGQTVSIMCSGDAWCDVVPINDWSFKRDKEDVVDRVYNTMRKEIMGDEA